MALALGVTALVIVALLADLLAPAICERLGRWRAGRRRPAADEILCPDPGRELRAERRARLLLRSCVTEEQWEMYRDLGFIQVWGNQDSGSSRRPRHGERGDGAPYAYLIYPHKPIVAYLPQTRELLHEYCVEFRDGADSEGGAPLPDSDDVLAKWMALTGDERRLLESANMHLPGRQVDPRKLRRDLWRLGEWESARARRSADALPAGSVPGS